MPPRRTIAAIDEVILPYPPAEVRRVISDLAHYQDWWGPPYRFEVVENRDGDVGTAVRMSNGSFLLWTATISEADAARVLLRLDQGAWTGEARWSVSECQEGTRLIFRIDVDPRPLWLRLLARSMDFKRRHSQMMFKVFTRLRERMDTVHAGQNQATSQNGQQAVSSVSGPLA
jgi:hypothetical protein